MSSDRAGAWRAFLRAANGLAAHRAEVLWARSCAAVNLLRLTRHTPRWSSPGRQRVMVIAPHPDDELGCAGTLIRHRDAGDQVRIVTLTDGHLSRAYGFDGPSIAERRREEAVEAASRMGAELLWLGLPEGDWQPEAGEHALRRALVETAPSVVYAPSIVDYHPEHRRVARTLAAALRQAAPVEIRVYAIQVPLTPLLVNLVHDVSDLAPAIRRAYAAHASQRQTTANMMRLKRYAARLYGAPALAEAFCAMPSRLYADLQRTDAAPKFRGLYPRAWTDPLAALAGWRERIAWRRALRQSEAAPPPA